MKIYILKESVKVGGKIVFAKGDKFFASDIFRGGKGERVYYPVGMMPNEYKPTYLGLDMTQSVALLVAAWEVSLHKGNKNLAGAKFKVVEDKTIIESPERELFWDAIQKEIADNTAAVSTANRNLKFLKTLEICFQVFNNKSAILEDADTYYGYKYSQLKKLSPAILRDIVNGISRYKNGNKEVPAGNAKAPLIKYIVANAKDSK